MGKKLSTIFSNTFAQLVAKFFGAGLTLLTTFFTIRLAGLDLYGDLTRILVLSAVGFTIIDFGLNAQGVRMSHSRDEMLTQTLHILVLRSLMSLIVIVALILLVYLLPGGYSSGVKSVFWISAISILFQGIFTSANSFFQHQLSYWKSTISIVTGSLVTALLTLYFLYFFPTLSSLVFAVTLGYIVMSICSYLLLPPLPWKLLRSSMLLNIFKGALILGLIIVSSVIASKIDTIILGVFRSSSEVGQYGFAYRIFDVTLVLPVFAMNAIYPLLLQDKKSNIDRSLISKSKLSLGIFGLIIGIVLYLSSPVVLYIKPGMNTAVLVLKLLSLSLPLFYLTAPLMWENIAKHKDLFVLKVYLSAAFLNFCLNIWFIPRYGAISAAAITGITELYITLLLLYSSAYENSPKY